MFNLIFTHVAYNTYDYNVKGQGHTYRNVHSSLMVMCIKYSQICLGSRLHLEDEVTKNVVIPPDAQKYIGII